MYLANTAALMQWYIHVRSQFISKDFPEELFNGLKETLNMAIEERIKRLKEYYIKIQTVKQQNVDFDNQWSELAELLMHILAIEGDQKIRDIFLKKIHTGITKSGKDYLSVIKGLTSEDATIGTSWLQGIVDQITGKSLEIMK